MILRIVFAVLVLAVAIALHVYLYRRLVRDVTDHRLIRIVAMVAIGALIATSIVERFARFNAMPSTVMTIILPLWLGFLIYVGLALLAADVVRWGMTRARRAPAVAAALPVSPERRLFLSRAVAGSSVLAGTGLAALGAYRAFAPPRITEVPLKIARWPKALDGFTIAQLSDVHIGPILQRRFLDELVSRANALKPDLAVITGDLVDGRTRHIGSIVEGISAFKGKYGTHFVTGNHDYYSEADEWVTLLSGWGINVLRNRGITLGDPGAQFDLLGVDDFGMRGSGDYDLKAAMAKRSPDRASILLAHQPSGFDEVADAGIDLQLSGHTHGGQTFPGTGVAWLMWGARSAGLSQTKDSHLYVSRGCGFVGPPTRLGSPPEIVKLILLAG